ncbi:co-chaperone DjlA [Corallococcus caeni]|nr:co-chaperone DjlA [Corallococcus sp. KH5-1]
MLGLMAGLLLGGPWAIVLGLIVGTGLGHYFDEQHAAPPDFPELFSDFPATFEPPPRQAPLSQGPGEFPIVQAPDEDPLDRDLTALFVDVARADGEMRREEVREVRRYFEDVLHADSHTVQAVRRHLKDFLSHPATLDAPAALASCLDSLPSGERLRLLDALYEMALADGPLQRSEREALKRMAEGLDVPDAKAQALAEQHLGDATAHYATLGLPPDATDAEVKSAYRKLAAQHHPDKASHLGPRAAERAARQFQAVRDAYEEIRRLRGL